jgi:hypothetical protein
VSLPEQFRSHAALLPPGLYQNLLFAMAQDWEAGGVVRQICAGWEEAPSSDVVQLRLLAGLQRLVLDRQAPQLAMYYPDLGGTAASEHAWADVEPVLRAHLAELREALQLAPQTNEPGRSVPLLIGLFDAVRRSGLNSVRLLEVGASAGLNLLVDQYFISGDGWFFGPPESPVRFVDAVQGPVSVTPFRITFRRGCDLSPIDASTTEGRLRLTSFVWPHDLHRHERLRAALQVASSMPVHVDASPASPWLDSQLSTAPDPATLTVVWHSVTRQYWPESEVRAVQRVITGARGRLPLAHVAMESPGPAPDGSYRFAEVTVQLSVPGGVNDEQPSLLATAADHGIPTRIAPA